LGSGSQAVYDDHAAGEGSLGGQLGDGYGRIYNGLQKSGNKNPLQPLHLDPRPEIITLQQHLMTKDRAEAH